MSHYDVLGIKHDATQAEIEAAFEKFVGAYNACFDPILTPGCAKSVADAYRILRDPVRRTKYDSQLEGARSPVTERYPQITKHRQLTIKSEHSVDILCVTFDLARISLALLIGASGLWLLVTLVHYFWTHALF